jgi:hypothetical protein
MKARPQAPLACSTAQTNKRVKPVCQLGTVFAMFWPYYDCIQRLFSTAVRSRNVSNAQNIAILNVLRRSSNIAAPVRVLVAFLWTLLFSVFVLCSVYARLSKNEWSCRMEGLLHLYTGSRNILANHWWRFRIQYRNRSHEWLNTMLEHAILFAE